METSLLVLIHDAFQPLSYWDDFMPKDQYDGVAMDTHIYQMFTDEVCSLSMSFDVFNWNSLMDTSPP